jgi:hypothetical protein
MPRKETSVKDVLISDFKELSTQAVDLKTKINESKTSLKKEYFNKKLKKINKKVYSVMIELAVLEAKSKPKITTIEEATNDQV